MARVHWSFFWYSCTISHVILRKRMYNHLHNKLQPKLFSIFGSFPKHWTRTSFYSHIRHSVNYNTKIKLNCFFFLAPGFYWFLFALVYEVSLAAQTVSLFNEKTFGDSMLFLRHSSLVWVLHLIYSVYIKK